MKLGQRGARALGVADADRRGAGQSPVWSAYSAGQPPLVIDLQTADTQFASMYLGFASKDLDQNQITDYLVRVVQPKLSAISGVQRAEIFGDRTFAMRVWLKPEKMAALESAGIHVVKAPSAMGEKIEEVWKRR